MSADFDENRCLISIESKPLLKYESMCNGAIRHVGARLSVNKDVIRDPVRNGKEDGKKSVHDVYADEVQCSDSDKTTSSRGGIQDVVSEVESLQGNKTELDEDDMDNDEDLDEEENDSDSDKYDYDDHSDMCDEDDELDCDNSDFEEDSEFEPEKGETVIANLHGWLIFQDSPDFRNVRFYALDELDMETAKLALSFFGPKNTSKISSIPNLADGGLLMIQLVRLDKEYRGRGLGMRLVIECLKRYVDQWKWAVVWPALYNSREVEGISKQEYDLAEGHVRAAFKRNGFTEVDGTPFLLLDVNSFVHMLTRKDFSGASLRIPIKPLPCSCIDGISPRALLILTTEASCINDNLRLGIDECADMLLPSYMHDVSFADLFMDASFIPLHLSLTKTNVRGFQHLFAVIIELLRQQPPIIPTESDILSYIFSNNCVRYSDHWGWASVRSYLKAGGSVLDALDCVFHRAADGLNTFACDTGEDNSDSFTSEHDNLRACKEHDGTKSVEMVGRGFEVLRARIWAAAGRNGAIRGPYRVFEKLWLPARSMRKRKMRRRLLQQSNFSTGFPLDPNSVLGFRIS